MIAGRIVATNSDGKMILNVRVEICSERVVNALLGIGNRARMGVETKRSDFKCERNSGAALLIAFNAATYAELLLVS